MQDRPAPQPGTIRPEIVVGLVAPLGTPLTDVSTNLGTILRSEVGYESALIKISSLLTEISGLHANLLWSTEKERYTSHMDAGDELRKRIGNDAMARLALVRLREERTSIDREDLDADLGSPQQLYVQFHHDVRLKTIRRIRGFKHLIDADEKKAIFDVLNPLNEHVAEIARRPLVTIKSLDEYDGSREIVPNMAWIIHSLKHPDEVKLLRTIYGSRFILLGVYSSREDRVKRLSSQLSRSASEFYSSTFLPEAHDLIRRDIDDLKRPHGQKARDAFGLSDVFLAFGKEYPTLYDQLRRVIRLFFGDTYITPTKTELAMMHAASAARRSSSMGRQVGASIINEDGILLATGCNDVPKPKGGQYWEGDEPDYRDHQLGHDESDRLRSMLLSDLLKRLCERKWLNESIAEEIQTDIRSGVHRLSEEVLGLDSELPEEGDGEYLFGHTPRSRVLSLIEYTRTVHAELAAITDCARYGFTIAGATLYTTTFPCHECTRHIVASGIENVVYIEPYPKSLAEVLSGHAIAVEEQADNKVNYCPFVGIGPERFLRLFSAKQRKDDDGNRLALDLFKEAPRVEDADLDARYSAEKEAKAIDELYGWMEEANLSWAPTKEEVQ